MDCSTPGLPVHHQLSELDKTHVHSTVSSSVIPFSSHFQYFPASGSFQMSQFFASGGQSIGVSALASVLPKNIQDLFPLGWTGWISLLSKLLSRVFSNTKSWCIHWYYIIDWQDWRTLHSREALPSDDWNTKILDLRVEIINRLYV